MSRLTLRQALRLLTTADEWYEWLCDKPQAEVWDDRIGPMQRGAGTGGTTGGYTRPDKAIPPTEGAQGDTP